MSEKTWEVEQVILHFDGMADILERAGKDIRDQAEKVREDGDVTHAAEVANIISNMVGNLRLDLLVRRPLRAAGRN